MANIKSSIKRISVTKNKQAQNKPIKSNLATEIKKFQASVAAGELKHAESQLNVVFSALDSAAADHVIHKNKADRQKAKLSAMLAKASKGKTKTAKTTAAKPAATTSAKTTATTSAKPAAKTVTAKTVTPAAKATATKAPATKTATAKTAAAKTATKTTKTASK